MRCLLSILFSCSVCSLWSATILYTNFELGTGYLHDGSYSAVGSGHYITVPRSYAQSQGWKMSNIGDETVIGGVKDVSQTPPPNYIALIYKGHNFSVSQYADVPAIANGVPYSGDLISSYPDYSNFITSGSTPYQGAYYGAFIPDNGSAPVVNSSGTPFVAYNENGQPTLYDVVTVDGQDYLSSGDGSISVPITDPSAIPVHYMQDGSLVSGVYNPSTGVFSSGSGSGSGSGSSSVDFSPVVNAVNNQGASIVTADNSNQSQLRSLLIEKLGASGVSWVYDCKLSLAQLVSLASSTGINVIPDFSNTSLLSDVHGLNDIGSSVLNMQDSILTAINNKNVSPVVNVDLSSVVNSVNSVKSAVDTSNGYLKYIPNNLGSRLSTMNTFLTNISDASTKLKNKFNSSLADNWNDDIHRITGLYDIINSWNTGNTLPSNLPQPDFGDDAPNDNLPTFAQNAWSADGVLSDSSVGQVWGDMVDWGDNGSPTMVVPDFISGFLTSWVGQIPSVGTDRSMFSFELNLPFVGQISKSWSWDEFPYISDFRAFLVWLVYLFFGLACFKLLHKTFI